MKSIIDTFASDKSLDKDAKKLLNLDLLGTLTIFQKAEHSLEWDGDHDRYMMIRDEADRNVTILARKHGVSSYDVVCMINELEVA